VNAGSHNGFSDHAGQFRGLTQKRPDSRFVPNLCSSQKPQPITGFPQFLENQLELMNEIGTTLRTPSLFVIGSGRRRRPEQLTLDMPPGETVPTIIQTPDYINGEGFKPFSKIVSSGFFHFNLVPEPVFWEKAKERTP
jgi:hypothetical protein